MKGIYIIFLITFISCTKEIDIDINSADPQIVIEGSIPTNNENAVIKISQSVDFSTENSFPALTGANVILSDNMGNIEKLSETDPGIYQSSFIEGIVGRIYYLEVNYENKKYYSFSTIPTDVKLDKVLVNKSTKTGGGPSSMINSSDNDESYEVIVQYSDPLNEDNYYRFVEYVNAEYIGSYVFDDRFSDGNVELRSLSNSKRKLQIGDTIVVEMQCIDKSVYSYFNSFSNLDGGPMNSTTPANPNTNIIGAELGYFNAYAFDRKIFIVN